MAKRRVHAGSIRRLSTITRSTVFRRHCPVALVVTALMLAVLPGRFWAQTIVPKQLPRPAERLPPPERTFEWDARDRLTAIVSGNRRSEFSYDGFDRRVRIVEKKNGAVVSDVWLLWCGAEICEQRVVDAGTSAPQKRFFRFGETDEKRAYFYTQDHLGSIRQMTSNNGVVVARYDYDPYGRMVKLFGEQGPSFGYANYYRHASSSLNLTKFRAYDPNLGRWLSRDPIAEDGGVNLYSDVFNNTINLVDFNGLQSTNQPSGSGNAQRNRLSWPGWDHIRLSFDFTGVMFTGNFIDRRPLGPTFGDKVKAIIPRVAPWLFLADVAVMSHQTGTDKRVLRELSYGGYMVDRIVSGKYLLGELAKGGSVVDKLRNPSCVREFWSNPIKSTPGLIDWLSPRPILNVDIFQ